MREHEVVLRMPVWMALSELFLDTELDAADYRRIRATLAASGHDSATLRTVLDEEVAPALGWNLLSVAGEWAFWSEEDLRKLILPRLSQSRRPRRSWIVRLALGHYLERQWALVDPRRSIDAS